ncbi:hypothetical protein Ahy_B04g069343 [Arachis hypogaea]|uniref:Myb/SANT-like domain-containing protein n=1 Tax=Arachis hypogaea TaxID=3818 RepID=A0A444ZCF2_ARAHY|nr:hypothetical protein Ahy_B04g069343 [Arachis hypogaea]
MHGENIEDANVEDNTNVIPDLGFQVNQVTSTDLYHPEPIQILTRVWEELEKRQHICVTSLSCYIMPNKGNKTIEANQPSKDNLRWSDDMDEVLLNVLAEEASKGNRHDGSWTTEAYANVVKSLSIAIGPHITKNHIKNRMKTLKDHFAEAYDLFHHLSGFAWNPVTRKFEAEEQVWQDFIKELFRADRATGKGATTSRERIQEIARDHIDLNDSFENVGFSDIDVNMGHDTPTFPANLDSPSGPHSQPNQLGGTSTLRGTKRKSPMNDFLEAQYEKVALEITTMADAVKEGTYLSSKLHDVAQRQVESAERQASVAERQVSVAEKQVSLIERQVAIAEKGLAIMQQSRPRLYSESDVWDMLTELGLIGSARMQCY